MILEKNLNKLFDCLPLFYRKLHPQRLHTGQYIEGEPFDYFILIEGETFCFDAKECKKNVLYASLIPVHQFNDLLKAEKHGAQVFFIIYFVSSNKLCFVHPRTILDEGKVTPESNQVSNTISKIILNHFKKRRNG